MLGTPTMYAAGTPHVTTKSSHVRLAVRVLGAVVLLFVGANHYYEYSADQYSVLPTIGTLFLLNFISATVVGLLFLAPLERMFHRYGRALLELVTVKGFGIAGTSLVALLVSEQTPRPTTRCRRGPSTPPHARAPREGGTVAVS